MRMGSLACSAKGFIRFIDMMHRNPGHQMLNRTRCLLQHRKRICWPIWRLGGGQTARYITQSDIYLIGENKFTPVDLPIGKTRLYPKRRHKIVSAHAIGIGSGNVVFNQESRTFSAPGKV